jgi:TolB-like protein/Flp pilus assembly protein TadD
MLLGLFCDGFVMEGRQVTYRFDDVTVDLATFRVFKHGRAVAVEPKAFEALVFLITNRGRVIEKSEIMNAVWKEAFVTENAMTRVIAQLRRALGDDPKAPRYIKTVQTRGYMFIPEVHAGEAAKHESSAALPSKIEKDRIESLAVLPLENLSADDAQEYFADAMTDELITELAKIGALRVISRTSVMQYKRVRKPLPQIARELNVDAVIEGSAIRAGDRVRITAQLLHAATDSHLWAESYERDLTDIFALQREVARAIASEVKIKLTPQERARLRNPRPVSPEACDAYLKGVYWFSQARDRLPARKDLLKKGEDYFEQAIRVSPDYAAAHAGLASVYRWLASYTGPALYPKAKRYALRALELDDSIAEAHAALGWISFKHEWDWAGAERRYQRAIELSQHSMYHQGYALVLSSLGRHREAIERVRIAETFDPLNLTIKAVIGIVYYCARMFDEAIEQLHNAVELDPEITLVRWALGWAYELRGEYLKAIHEFEEAMRLAQSNLFGAGFLGHAHGVGGNRGEAEKLLKRLVETSRRRYVCPYYIALIHLALGEKDSALMWLERAVEQKDDFATYLKVDPRLDELRADDRFEKLLRRMGLAP